MTTKNTTLIKSLRKIGSNEHLKNAFLDFIKDAEVFLAKPGLSVRDEITGPIIDAIHDENSVLKKKLSYGLVFNFLYRSKMARDFVMSTDEKPDHVWEPQTTKLLLHFCTGAKNVAIGGAYSGDQAIFVSDKIRSQGICHCFEPNKEQIEILKINTRDNKLDNLKVNRIGLWNKDDQRLFLVGEDAEAHPELLAPDGAGQELDSFATITLNTYGRRNNIKKFDLIMLDIEGAELSVLQGADHYLSQSPEKAPYLVFEVHRKYVDWSDGLDRSEIIEFLNGFGYSSFAVRDYHSNVPMKNQPIEIIRPENVYLEGPPHGFNMVAAKNKDVFSDPIFRICEGVSPKLLKHLDPRIHAPVAKR